MKKFLCYDTNDAASGKINVDSRGMLTPPEVSRPLSSEALPMIIETLRTLTHAQI